MRQEQPSSSIPELKALVVLESRNDGHVHRLQRDLVPEMHDRPLRTAVTLYKVAGPGHPKVHQANEGSGSEESPRFGSQDSRLGQEFHQRIPTTRRLNTIHSRILEQCRRFICQDRYTRRSGHCQDRCRISNAGSKNSWEESRRLNPVLGASLFGGR